MCLNIFKCKDFNSTATIHIAKKSSYFSKWRNISKTSLLCCGRPLRFLGLDTSLKKKHKALVLKERRIKEEKGGWGLPWCFDVFFFSPKIERKCRTRIPYRKPRSPMFWSLPKMCSFHGKRVKRTHSHTFFTWSSSKISHGNDHAFFGNCGMEVIHAIFGMQLLEKAQWEIIDVQSFLLCIPLCGVFYEASISCCNSHYFFLTYCMKTITLLYCNL